MIGARFTGPSYNPAAVPIKSVKDIKDPLARLNQQIFNEATLRQQQSGGKDYNTEQGGKDFNLVSMLQLGGINTPAGQKMLSGLRDEYMANAKEKKTADAAQRATLAQLQGTARPATGTGATGTRTTTNVPTIPTSTTGALSTALGTNTGTQQNAASYLTPNYNQVGQVYGGYGMAPLPQQRRTSNYAANGTNLGGFGTNTAVPQQQAAASPLATALGVTPSTNRRATRAPMRV